MRHALAFAAVVCFAACVGTEEEETSGTTATSSGTSGSTGTTSGTTSGATSSSGSTSGSTDAGLPCCQPEVDDQPACSCEGTCAGGCNTPLCLSFDGSPVEFTQAPGTFALSETPGTSDWIGGATPWLVLDRNGNGTVDDARELFGSMTRLPDGRVARDGFEALRPLDSNGDGWITSADAHYADLRLWNDRNQDRVAQPDELTTLASQRVVALQLTDKIEPRCDARGNCEIERAVFYFESGNAWHRGALVDAHLKLHPVGEVFAF